MLLPSWPVNMCIMSPRALLGHFTTHPGGHGGGGEGSPVGNKHTTTIEDTSIVKVLHSFQVRVAECQCPWTSCVTRVVKLKYEPTSLLT